METAFIDREVEVFTNDDGHYRGLVVSINTEKRELVLRKVKDMKTGKTSKKIKHFYKDHILNIALLADDESVDRLASELGESESQLFSTELDKGDLLLDASDDGPSLFQSQHIDPTLYLTDYEPPISNIELTEPPQTILIEVIGEKFTEAISVIQSQKVISFAVEGRRVIRKGEISLIVIGTRQLVYMFDIRSLGPDCISKGLKEILESQNILKVVFDIRMVSDCLHSLYDVHPHNIFDCQVADIFIYKRKYGQYPSEVATLSDCLQKYRNMPRDQCSFERTKMKMTQPNSKVWNKRPFPEDFIRLCYTNAMYIRELRLPMIEQLLGEYLNGVNVYLDCVRSLTDNGAKYYNTRKLPKAINSISAYKDKKVKKNNQMKRVVEPTALSDENSDLDTQEDRGSWNTGTTFTEQYQERHGEIVECKDSGRPLLDSTKTILKSTKGGGGSAQSVTDSRTLENVIKTPTDNVSSTSDGERCELQTETLDLCSGSSNNINSSLSYDKEERPIGEYFPLNTVMNATSYRDSDSPKIMNLRKPYIDEMLYADSCDEDTKPSDEYQISTSELDSEDSDLFFSSVNDPPRIKQQAKLKNISDEKEWPTLSLPHTVSNAGKQMIRNHITSNDSRQYSSRLSCTPPSFSEFPSIDTCTDTNERKLTNGHRSQPETMECSRDIKPPILHSFDEIRPKTPEIMDGVRKSTKPKFSGRGQTLQVLAQHSKKASKLVSPRYLDEGKHNSYEFPTDDELMKLPCVAPMVDNNTPIRGELVNVTKIYPSSS